MSKTVVFGLVVAWAALTLTPSAATAACASIGVAATPIAFGAYQPFAGSPARTTGEIQVLCTGLPGDAVAYEVNLSPGLHAAGGWRHLAGPDGEIAYNLYQDAALASQWGDGALGQSRGDSFVLATTAETRTYAVYGSAPARQNVPPGLYADRVTITVSF